MDAAIYVAIITQLPNCEYYDYLHDMDTANLQRVTTNVFVYSLLELLSLLILDVAVRWCLKFSLPTQLAFVLENQRMTITSKLVLWIVYIIQGSLQHYGKALAVSCAAVAVFSFTYWASDHQFAPSDRRKRLHVAVRMATAYKARLGRRMLQRWC